MLWLCSHADFVGKLFQARLRSLGSGPHRCSGALIENDVASSIGKTFSKGGEADVLRYQK